MLTQHLVNLQVIIQRLPLAVNPQRHRRVFQEIDQLTFPFPAAEHPHVKLRVARLSDQIERTVTGQGQHRGFAFHAVQPQLTVVERQVGDETIETCGVIVITHRLNVAAAALHRLLNQLLKVHAIHPRIAHLDARLALPVMAKRPGINVRAGEIARQRHFTGQGNGIMERFQNRAYLHIIKTRLEHHARSVSAGIQRAGQ